MRRTFVLGAVLLMTACSQSHPTASGSLAASPAAGSAATVAPPATAVRASATAASGEEQIVGPAGMTLAQEIGAVMMVGFEGPLTETVLDDWRQRQFGALILVPANRNAQNPAGIAATVQRIRAVAAHALLAATDHEGGSVCFGETGVPCLAGRREAEMATMSQGLKALGFDINLAPDARTWDVMPAVAGIHAAGMYATARGASDLATFQAAARAGADFMMVGSVAIQRLRTEVGFSGLVISDDLQLAERSVDVPSSAVRFLQSGGDMVMVAHDLAVADATYDAIRAAVLNGSYPRAQLDASVTKLLSLRLRYMP